jgi:PAS domain S-box-containing protein
MNQSAPEGRAMIDHLIGTGRAPLPGAEEILEYLSQAADVGLLAVAADGTAIFANDVACGLLGRHRNEVLGHGFLRQVPPPGRMRAWRKHLDTIAGKTVADSRWQLAGPDGGLADLTVEHRWLRAADGTAHHLLILSRTDREEGRAIVAGRPANADGPAGPASPGPVANEPAGTPPSPGAPTGYDYFDAAPEALFVVAPDRTGRFVFDAVNRAFEAMSGIAGARILGRTAEAAFEPDTAAMLTQAFRQVWQTGEPLEWTGEVAGPQGRRQWQIRLATAADAGGRIGRLQGSARDVTADLRSHQKLKETQDLLASIFDIADIGISVSDEQARIIRVNRSYAEIFGYDQKDLIGRDILSLVSDGDRPQLEKRKALILAGVPVPPREVRIKHHNGGYRIGSASSRLFVSSAGEKLMVTAVSDLTRQKRLEQELREREERLLAIANNMPALIALIDAEGRIVFANALMENWLTQPGQDLVGRTLATAAPARTYRALAPHIAQALDGEHAGFQQPLRMADGSRRHFRFNLIPRTIDGRPSGYFLFGSDITAVEDAKDALRRAKDRAEAANEAKSQFLANMSHELRTPLNAIIGFSDIMANEILGPMNNSVYHNYTQDILKSGHHLHELINDVLDLSKIEAGQFELYEEELDVAQAVETAQRLVQMRADQAGVRIVVVPADRPWKLVADPRAIRQMLINLLSNAVKFTPSAGSVTVACRPEGEDFLIEVADTGIGIPAEKLADVTKPFYQIDNVMTRRHQGTGIGLSITETLMNLHGGALRLESCEDRGTRATLVFPASRLKG